MDDILARSRALLRTAPARWDRIVAAAGPELLAREPAPGEWSALQCLRHLLDTEEHVFPVRVQAFLAGRDFAAFDPDAEGTLVTAETDPAALVRRFTDLRGGSVVALERVTVDDLGRTARHAELGIVSLREMLHEWVGHDLMHTVQAERALLQPFIVGSGPWRGYFADHDVEATRS